ncbi:uncharacterized protein C1orf226 [Nematolebias whitei]|uniref:uncharacterized protein C1orf226 n=1 Tax=Nematolebias whitei TaxID=451745 RepID=UPI001898668E|nr:uncharacterized protein C1orf226 [Nematolebias whitei]
MPSEKYLSPRVDQSLFENSVAQQQSPQTSRLSQVLARRPPASAYSNAGSTCTESPSSGGQQRLKNAINLGKAVGAKVNDLLRRKELSHLGDIGVTEINKNVGAVWSCMDQLGPNTTSSHISSFDSFPRLDPPPPTGKKRLPRALKTTQDMMISSDPVVSSLEASDSHSFVPSPETMPKEETRSSEEQRKGREEEATDNNPAENKVSADSESKETSCELDGVSGGGGGEEEEGVKGSTEGGVEENQFQLQLSVPDLINKDPPLDSKSKPCDVWQRASSPDSRLASTPRSGRTHCRISLGEEVLLGNGAPCSKDSGGGAEDAEPHPDLLSFE